MSELDGTRFRNTKTRSRKLSADATGHIGLKRGRAFKRRNVITLRCLQRKSRHATVPHVAAG